MISPKSLPWTISKSSQLLQSLSASFLPQEMDKPPPPNVVFHYLKSKDYPTKAQGMSFFAFLFSVFVYISIFYIFNLSPSKLFHNTKFWFFISNTLIIIIAMDYGLFSSSSNAIYYNKQHTLLQDEYVTTSRQVKNSSAVSVRTIYPEGRIPKEEIKKEIIVQPQKKKEASLERKVSAGLQNQPPCVETKTEAVSLLKNEGDDHPLENNVPIKSRTVKKVTFDESRNIIRNIEADDEENIDEQAAHDDHVLVEDHHQEKNDEYANMSNEELNRRVEEFIQRFNTQIRLQAQAYAEVR